MNKTFLFLFVFCLISLASAQLIISPDPMVIETRVNQPSSFSLTLNNTFEFDIFNFTFGNLSSYGFNFGNVNISANSSKLINFNVTTSTSHHFTVPSNVEFKFYVDLPEEITTHHVNITAFGFDPNFLVIRDGDTVVWHNLDDISHRVFSSFNYQVPVNGTAQHTFTGIGTTTYYDPNWVEFSSFTATIEVVNRTARQIAHNPNYDVLWNVDLNSLLNPTVLDIVNSADNYTVEYQKFKRGVFTITNNGSETAEIVHLSSDSNWITFNRNDFTLNRLDQEFVEYTITPIIIETNQTDKTYFIPIRIKASNSEEYVFNVSVYIPFKEVVSSIGSSDIDLVNWLQNVFCPVYPTSFLCNQTIMQQNPLGNGSLSEVNITVSAVDYIETKKAIARMEDSGARRDNEVKELKDTLTTELPSTRDQLNGTRQEISEMRSLVNSIWDFIWIIGLFTFLTIVVVYITKTTRKRKYGEALVRGAFHYTK